jgi:hypothetical protein
MRTVLREIPADDRGFENDPGAVLGLAVLYGSMLPFGNRIRILAGTIELGWGTVIAAGRSIKSWLSRRASRDRMMQECRPEWGYGCVNGYG